MLTGSRIETCRQRKLAASAYSMMDSSQRHRYGAGGDAGRQ